MHKYSFAIKLLARLTVVLACLLYYICSPIGGRPFYEFFLYGPRQSSEKCYQDFVRDCQADEARPVRFASKNGNILDGYLFINKKASKTVLFHHGNGFNITCLQGYVTIFLREGYSVLTYDYQGYGKSQGTAKVQNMIEDSDAATDYLEQTLHIKPTDIIQCGGSFGTGLAARQAGRHPCAALILMSPYRSLYSVGRKRFPVLHLYPDSMMTMPNIDTLAAAKRVTAPIWMIHGDSDFLIPISEADELAAGLVGKNLVYLRLKGHGHNDYFFAEVLESLHSFLACKT